MSSSTASVIPAHRESPSIHESSVIHADTRSRQGSPYCQVYKARRILVDCNN